MIALDAMGGDNAPAAVVAGAVAAKREFGCPSILVGRRDAIQAELDRLGATGELEIHHAEEVIGMDESPMKAIRSKRDSSIRVACSLVKNGEAEAVVSAGNSGAVMASGVFVMGRIKGIERPALASVFPSLKGSTVVIDVGANVDSRPRHLYQFAIMGELFARMALGLNRPRVGLLSVGEEDAKGNDVTRRAHDMLRGSELNFIGNVEGRDIFAGEAEVIVCDGFVGNVCLKLAEGTASAMMTMIKREIMGSWRTKLGGLLLKPALMRFAKRLNYSEYGGAPLLGVKGACLICHGASDPTAIKNAVRLAEDWVDLGFYNQLAEAVGQAQALTHAVGQQG